MWPQYSSPQRSRAAHFKHLGNKSCNQVYRGISKLQAQIKSRVTDEELDQR